MKVVRSKSLEVTTNLWKCDESKPTCEYCSATNRKCVYPQFNLPVAKLRMRHAKGVKNNVFLLADKRIVETQSNSFQHSYNYFLNSPSKIMNISTFEFGLLKYFETDCIPLLTFGVDKSAEYIWRRVAPSFYVESTLLKLSIYLLSSLVLWHRSNVRGLPFAINVDIMSSTPNMKNKLSRRYGHSGSLTREEVLMFSNEYFSIVVEEKRNLIGKFINSNVPSEQKFFLAIELNLCSALIFTFLGTHSLMPLLSLDDTIKHDFLAICQGVSAVRDHAIKEFNGFAQNFNWTRFDSKGRMQLANILREELQEYYQKGTFGSYARDEYELCYLAINALDADVSIAASRKFPVPIFVWPLQLDPILIEKMRRFQFFPLRLLYIYACLCYITDFHWLDSKNMWIDFIKWFKNFNYVHFGGWKYQVDAGVYELVGSQFKVVDPERYTVLLSL